MRTHESDHSRQDAISLADEPAVIQTLSGALLNLWQVVNDLTRLKPSKRDRYRVTIFGSALVGRMWPGLIEWVRGATLTEDPPLASPADLTIPVCLATGDEAITLLRERQARRIADRR
jgi:hypothetical protein